MAGADKACLLPLVGAETRVAKEQTAATAIERTSLQIDNARRQVRILLCAVV